MDDRQKVITIAHPEHSSGELIKFIKPYFLKKKKKKKKRKEKKRKEKERKLECCLLQF